MAITTFDGASSGVRPPVAFSKVTSGTLVAGRPFSYWPIAGAPGAGAYNTTLAGATRSNADAGSLSKGNPASGNAYLYNLVASASGQAGVLYLVDRLWQGGGLNVTLTTAQTVNSVAWPSRCPTSAINDAPDANGHGIMVGVEVSAATGAGTPTLTLGYTNSAGTASRTATNVVPTVATSPIGTFYPIGLQAGDVGVRSIQTLTLSATWTSGTINLVAYRVIAAVPLVAAGVPSQVDWISGGAARIYDSSCLQFLFVPQTTSASMISGMFVETQG